MKNKPSNIPSEDCTSRESDLPWVAFCYAVGELHDEQAIAFEKRLAHDLEAQTALAEVTSTTSLAYGALDAMTDVPSLNVARPLLDSQMPAAEKKVKPSRWNGGIAMAVALLVLASLVTTESAGIREWDWHRETASNIKTPNVQTGSVGRFAMLSSDAMLVETDLWERWSSVFEAEVQAEVGASFWQQKLFDSERMLHDDSDDFAETMVVEEDLISLFASAFSVSGDTKGDL
jgi:anti-sigma factor RsiW